MCLLKIFKDLNISDSKLSSLIVNHNCTIMNFISFITDLSLTDFSHINSEEADFLSFLKINVLQEFFI